MNAVTFRMVEKLMEQHYEQTPMFLEEEGKISYGFTIKKDRKVEISATLHLSEESIELYVEKYVGKEKEPSNVYEHTMTTYKELTELISFYDK